MVNFPDFTTYDYQIIEQLGRNPQGGRVTYKAVENNTQDFVVIKQFKFITSQDWDGYKAVEREINVLKGLNHSGIPCYLASFEPEDGLCLVQEYKNAQPLSITRSFAPEEVKEIAIQLLEILIYLQNRIPPIIHRDIKPDNVLIDEQLRIYLVDFGYARVGKGEVTALSSMVAGTTGFMPPEQLLNRPLTEASDLYGLGATLICLLTQTKSVDLNSLVNYNFQINFKSLLPKLNLRFIDWLEKIVQPDINQRFKNAKEALDALISLDLIGVPEVQFSQTELRFYASQLGDMLTQTIILTNPIPETVLEGKWSVKTHFNDPQHTPDSHAWISFRPQQFKGNQVKCEVIVDISKLKTDQVYQREIILSSNAALKNYPLNLIVQTAYFPIEIARKNLPYLSLAGILLLSTISGLSLGIFASVGAGTMTIWILILGTSASAIWAALLNATLDVELAIGSTITAVLWGTLMGALWGTEGAILGAITAVILVVIGCLVNKFLWKYKERNVYFCLFLTIIFGITTGVGAVIGWLNPYILFLLTATGLPLSALLVYPFVQQARLKAQYRKREKQHLIEL